MTTRLSSNDPGPLRIVGRVLRTPFRRQTYRNLLYLALMFPLGAGYFALLTVGFSTGVSLVAVLVGVPILLGLFAAAVELARFERFLVRSLLDVDVGTPVGRADGPLWRRLCGLATALRTWKALAYLLSEFVYGSVAFGFLASGIATSASLLLAPFYYATAPVAVYGPLPAAAFTLDVAFGWDSLFVGLTRTFQFGSWRIETLAGALLVSGVGAGVLVATLLFGNAVVGLWGRYARRMLATPRPATTPDR